MAGWKWWKTSAGAAGLIAIARGEGRGASGERSKLSRNGTHSFLRLDAIRGLLASCPLPIAPLAVFAMAAALFFAVAAVAQYPQYPESYPPPGYYPNAPERVPPPPAEPIEDPSVQPAQYVVPGGYVQPPRLAGGYAPNGPPLSDPPSPVVRIQVRVAADSAVGDDIKYIITIRNTASADAHAVTVRNPLADSLEPVKAEPDWDKNKSTLSGGKKQLVWSFGTLGGGKSKTIELTLRPKADATEVRNLAYVQFEYGEAVTTRLSKPTLRVTKTASRQAVRDEPCLVRLLIENTGRVIAEDVRVTENVPESAEFEPVTRGARRSAQPSGQQWVWEFARLMPGERKVIEFRMTPRSEAEAVTLTNVAAAKDVNEKAEARTQVLVPSIGLKMSGPTGVIGPGEAAAYEIVVRNTGTLASNSIQVVGTIPAECKPTMKTEGGQLAGDAIRWTIPHLEPGEAQSFRFRLRASTTGKRTVTASVVDARNQKAGDEISTMFQGSPALSWESSPTPPALSVGRSGSFTIKVRNSGGEAARDVRLEVDIDRPDALTLGQISPSVRPAGGKLVFAPEVIGAQGEAVFAIPFEARAAAQVWFKLKLTAEYLGGRSMQTEKAVEITGPPK